MHDRERGLNASCYPTGSTETQDPHACLPGEPARESPLLKAKVRDTETGTKESGPRACEWHREDKHKRETKSKVGESVCSWFVTISHFLAKITLALESTGILRLWSHSPERQNKMSSTEGLLRG